MSVHIRTNEDGRWQVLDGASDVVLFKGQARNRAGARREATGAARVALRGIREALHRQDRPELAESREAVGNRLDEKA